MLNTILDWDKYCTASRQANAEGTVLICNKNNTLPLKKGSKAAVFGRMQTNYYKSGTGSGGMVNVSKVISILEGFKECGDIILNKKLMDVYAEWEKTHPFDRGIGWGNEPWSQEEMPLSKELVQSAAAESSEAIVIIARTAGEDQDSHNKPGSYLLTDKEEDMLSKVSAAFDRVIVVLNVGNIIDMSFMDRYDIDAVLYVWQGGMLGGAGVADVLTGKAYPSGKLTDTIAYSIEDYPSSPNFGGLKQNLYAEDIYVGYRYFETTAKDKVRYPFGFGLSYTDFQIEVTEFKKDKNCICLEVSVSNIGEHKGKEVVQIYYEAPQGALGKPVRSLLAFRKTEELQPGQVQSLRFEIKMSEMASYDDAGITGHKSCYVLEAGEYKLYAGNNVREAHPAGSFTVNETTVTEKLSEALAPVTEYSRMKPVLQGDRFDMDFEKVPLGTVDSEKRRRAELPEEIHYSEDRGIKLIDVKQERASLAEFIAQLSNDDLACIIRGEGMGSPKVTPGTAAAFGGVSESLKAFGIPCGCCSDGPSGIRMDSGAKAFSLPCGTLLACTFNEELVEELYSYTGLELVKNKIDSLLGPGMNIHRHPLNGRNFEYFSEDPLVTGKIGAAQLRGLHKAGVTGTVKHFCGNNQETKRHEIDSVISERALREIYLKGFEIAVKEGNAVSVMTTYGAVNGIWTAGNYDLNTRILRKEWGFTGIVMTDWWANINEKGKPADKTNFAAMARAQNDLYMVCPNASAHNSDNTLKALREGALSRGELQRNAMNICRFLMNSHALDRMNGLDSSVEILHGPMEDEARNSSEILYHKVTDSVIIPLDHIDTSIGTSYAFGLDLKDSGSYQLELTGKSDSGELAQIPVTVYIEGIAAAVFTWNGTGGSWIAKTSDKVFIRSGFNTMKLHFGQSGVSLKEIKIRHI